MLVMAVERYRLAIFFSPKTGCGVIRRIVYSLKGMSDERVPIRTAATATNIRDIAEYTLILVCRDPLERLVSSFFMPEVPSDITFRDFVTQFASFTGPNQALQSTGHARTILDQCARFDYVLQTSELVVLPKLLASITHRPPVRLPWNTTYKRTSSAAYSFTGDITKSRMGGLHPPWQAFYDPSLWALALDRTQDDHVYFARFGIVWPTDPSQAFGTMSIKSF